MDEQGTDGCPSCGSTADPVNVTETERHHIWRAECPDCGDAMYVAERDPNCVVCEAERMLA